MHRNHPFWEESDSTAAREQLFAPRPDEVRRHQRAIGADLRQWYDDVTREPIPDEWLGLLQQGGDSRTEAAEKIGDSEGTVQT